MEAFSFFLFFLISAHDNGILPNITSFREGLNKGAPQYLKKKFLVSLLEYLKGTRSLLNLTNPNNEQESPQQNYRDCSKA